MRRGFGWGAAILVVLLLVGVGIGAYNWGVTEGLERTGEGVEVVRYVGGHGFGFFPFFLFFPLFFLALFLLALLGQSIAGYNVYNQEQLEHDEPTITYLRFVVSSDFGANVLEKTPNTQVANQTGLPAMSVPLSWNAAGLPIGVQFMAPFGDEATLFQLAAQLEVARPWAGRVPPISAR